MEPPGECPRSRSSVVRCGRGLGSRSDVCFRPARRARIVRLKSLQTHLLAGRPFRPQNSSGPAEQSPPPPHHHSIWCLFSEVFSTARASFNILLHFSPPARQHLRRTISQSGAPPLPCKEVAGGISFVAGRQALQSSTT